MLRAAVLHSATHARATRIEVCLTFLDDALQADICDDGSGLDDAVALHGKDGHRGINGMRERVARLGGRIGIAPGPHGGVAVRLAIPAQRAYA